MAIASSDRAVASRRWARPGLIGLLLGILALVPLTQIAVIVQPALDPDLGIFSAALAVMTGAGALLGVALLPLLDRLGRIGAILYAAAIVIYLVGNGLGLGSHPNYPTGTPFDIVFALLVPAGYLMLLLGALRSAGWIRVGAIIVSATGLALTVITVVAPPGPLALPVDQMANRMVFGALFAAGALVAGIAALVESGRRGASPTAQS